MNKDVIYIDVEDDITAIIGKVKDAHEKIVALVPPKRIGVLQSAVNLRLLTRAAQQNHKRLVLITSNSALISLAASAKIPIAKTLQSKPELAEIAALDVDEGEDVIDGSQLPVGELMKTAGMSTAASITDPAVEDLIRENAADDMPRAVPPGPGQKLAKARAKTGIKVPNFNQFRKKLVLIIGGGVLLLGLLVWAIFFAPHATILITARTSDSSANAKVTLDNTATTNFAASTLKTVSVQTKKDMSVEFDATGTKEVGEKAQGQVVFKNCETMTPQSVPAGTVISSGSKNFVTQSAVSVPAGTGGFGGCSTPGTSTAVAVTAQEIGDTYNIANGTNFTVEGHPSGSSTVYFKAVSTTDMAGGSKKTVKVPSASDIQKATEQLTQQNTDTVKSDLKKQLPSSATAIDQTFKVTQENPKSTPAVNEEAASGKAKLTASVTYSISGVERSEYSRFLDDYFAKQIEGKDDQRVYDNGAKKVTFTDVIAAGNGFTGKIVANAKIGPKINDDEIKNLAKGKRYGDIQAQIEAIQGIDDVDIKFSPFWVSSVPNDTKKISIEFQLNE